MKKLIIFLALLQFTTVLPAVDKVKVEFTDATQEQRYAHLTEELRCVVCQNQSLADSNADLAQDLRDQVRDMILQGKTDEQITDYLVLRYGDFVLYNPPLKPKTYVLWLAPSLLVFVALLAIIYFIRRHVKMTTVTPELTEEERNKMKQLFEKQGM